MGGTGMNIIRMLYMLGFMIMTTLIFVALDLLLQLGLTSSEETLNIFIIPFITICSFIFFLPVLRKSFFAWFLLDKKEIHQAICFPILAAILSGFLVNFYRLLPYWLGFDPVGVGSQQVTVLDGVSPLGLALGTSVLGPFSEEFLFRYLMFSGIILLWADFPPKWVSGINEHIQKRKKTYWIGWVLLVNVIFALLHGPNLLNFPLYFLPGIVDTLFFLRYGFLAAWISHGVFNLFSGITLHIILRAFF